MAVLKDSYNLDVEGPLDGRKRPWMKKKEVLRLIH